MVLTPLVKSWKARTTRIADLRKSVTQGKTLVDRDQSIRSRWTQMRTNTLSTEISVAESQMLNAFDRWSRESGVVVTQIRPQWKRATDEYNTLECRADLSGSLSSLTRFLYLMERDSLAVKLDSIELTTRDNSGQQINLGLQISGLQLAPPRS
jgi:hypothetical protein